MIISTRLLELGLPLFSGLDLGALMSAQADMERGDFSGMSKMTESLGRMGATKTVRKLAALWGASEIELRAAESDPAMMANLEERTADLPFAETFKAAMDFQLALFAALGVAPASSSPEIAPPLKKKATASRSAV